MQAILAMIYTIITLSLRLIGMSIQLANFNRVLVASATVLTNIIIVIIVRAFMLAANSLINANPVQKI